MSDHGGINHGAILVAFFASGGVGFQTARESSEQLVAENQRLRDALSEAITLCERHGAVRTAVIAARAALAGTSSEDTPSVTERHSGDSSK